MSGYCSLIAAWYCVPSDQKRVSPPTFLPPAITGERPIIIIIIIIIGILIVLTNTGWFPQPPAKIFESWWSRAILFAVDRNFWEFLGNFWHILAGQLVSLSTGQLVLLNAGNHRNSCHHHHHDLPIREYLRQAFCDPPSPWKGREGSLWAAQL